MELSCEFGPCVNIGNPFGPGSVPGVTSSFCSSHPWVCQQVSMALARFRQYPISLSVTQIVAGQLTYQPSTNTLCSDVGLGASYTPTKAFTVGIYNNGADISKWQEVLSGFGYSFGANIFAGYQMSRDNSGKTIGGPSLSPGVGISASYTWGKCGPAPWPAPF